MLVTFICGPKFYKCKTRAFCSCRFFSHLAQSLLGGHGSISQLVENVKLIELFDNRFNMRQKLHFILIGYK